MAHVSWEAGREAGGTMGPERGRGLRQRRVRGVQAAALAGAVSVAALVALEPSVSASVAGALLRPEVFTNKHCKGLKPEDNPKCPCNNIGDFPKKSR